MRPLISLFCVVAIFALFACSPRPKGIDQAMLELSAMDDDSLIAFTLPDATRTNDPDARKQQLRKAEQIQLNLAKFLLKAGAHANARNAEGRTPLILSSIHNRGYLVPELLLQRAKIRIRDRYDKIAQDYTGKKNNDHNLSTLFTWAGEKKYSRLELNQYLILASDMDSFSLSIFLIAQGADPNLEYRLAQNIPTKRPLLEAAGYCNLETVRVLLSRGADINITDSNGKTVLLYALSAPYKKEAPKDHLDTIELLLDHGADPNQFPPRYERPPLHWALFLPELDYPNDIVIKIIKILLDHGVSPNTIDDDSRSALQDAVERNYKEAVLTLLSYGADPTYEDNLGYSLLKQTKDPEILSILVEHGADISKVDGTGETLLMYAAKNHWANLAKTCLDLGADPNIVGREGKTALSLAKNPQIISLLKSAGAKR